MILQQNVSVGASAIYSKSDMTKEEFKEELISRCMEVRKEFPHLTALEVYICMIRCKFDKDKARSILRQYGNDK